MNKNISLILIFIAIIFGVWFMFLRGNQVTIQNNVSVQNLNTITQLSDEIVGRWQSVEDPAYTVEYKADGTVRDFNNEQEILQEKWVIDGNVDKKYGEMAKYKHLQITSEGNLFDYAIVELSSDKLLLNYLSHGNMLEYKRIK